MKVESICFLVLVVGFANCGFIPANTLIRTPFYHSAFVRTNQAGGNFAYSAVEGPGYPVYSGFPQHIPQQYYYPYASHPYHFGYHQAPVSYYTPSIAGPPVPAPAPPAPAPAPPAPGPAYFAHNPFLNPNQIFANPIAPAPPAGPTEESPDNTTEAVETTTDEKATSENDEDTVSIEAA